jgi:hypothetical protein
MSGARTVMRCARRGNCPLRGNRAGPARTEGRREPLASLTGQAAPVTLRYGLK